MKIFCEHENYSDKYDKGKPHSMPLKILSLTQSRITNFDFVNRYEKFLQEQQDQDCC